MFSFYKDTLTLIVTTILLLYLFKIKKYMKFKFALKKAIDNKSISINNKIYLNNQLFLFLMVLVISLISLPCFSQIPSVGLRYLDSSVSDGFTLFTPELNNSVYLINNCGEVIIKWEFTEKPGATCYFLKNGNLLRAGKKSLEIRDWNNTVVWTFLMENIGNQHHDIEPLPNGNILCIVTDSFSKEDIISYGRNTENIEPNFRLDKIVEIQPKGINEGDVVWEWRIADHLIQNFDETKLNYGDISSHPELIDINFENGFNNDYTHANAIDYNEDLDQIIISVRHLSEIFIIDHSTTTSEAKGSTGGSFNKGGDILWRWGNPQVYKQGTEQDQQLFLQHDSKWVEKGYLDEGKVTVFNNGNNNLSSTHIIKPVIIGKEYLMDNNVFLPVTYEWSWKEGVILGEILSEGKKSGVHALPNGNFMVCQTSIGQISEINKNGDVLWVYKNPTGTNTFDQFEEPLANGIFRGEKYPIDYIGFSNVELEPVTIIEDINDISSQCIENRITDLEQIDALSLIINPVENGSIKFTKSVNIEEINILDFSGRILFKRDFFTGNILNINLSAGIYIFKYKYDSKVETKKLLVL